MQHRRGNVFLDKKLDMIGTLAGPVGSLNIPDDAFPIYVQSCLKGSCPDDEFRLEITDAHCYVIRADLVDTDPDQYTYSTSRWPCAWGAKPIPPHMKPLSKNEKKQSSHPKKALESKQKPSAHQKGKPSEK